jgi:F0F1-type ATP synthase membrane subunit b/b'
MDTTIITNVLFTVLSIFLIIITYIFWLLASSLKSLIDTTENQIEKVAENIDNIRAKAKYSQTIFASAIMHSLSFIKKIIK